MIFRQNVDNSFSQNGIRHQHGVQTGPQSSLHRWNELALHFQKSGEQPAGAAFEKFGIIQPLQDGLGAFFKAFAFGQKLAEHLGAAGALAVETGTGLKALIDCFQFNLSTLQFFFTLHQEQFVALDFLLEFGQLALRFRFLGLLGLTFRMEIIDIALKVLLPGAVGGFLALVAGDFGLGGDDNTLGMVHRLPGLAQGALDPGTLLAGGSGDAAMLVDLLLLTLDIFADGNQGGIGGLQFLFLIEHALLVGCHIAGVLGDQVFQFLLALRIKTDAAVRGLHLVLHLVELVAQIGKLHIQLAEFHPVGRDLHLVIMDAGFQFRLAGAQAGDAVFQL